MFEDLHGLHSMCSRGYRLDRDRLLYRPRQMNRIDYLTKLFELTQLYSTYFISKVVYIILALNL